MLRRIGSHALWTALLVATASGGCGGGSGDGGTTTTSAPTVATSTTTSVPGPSPRVSFRSPHRAGYWFVRRPLVVKEDRRLFTLYVHMNRRLPKGVGAEVDGTFGGFGLRSTTFGHDPRACYGENMDILRDATVPVRSVKPGDLVTVRVELGRGHGSLRVRVPLVPRDPHQDDAADPANLYLALIGCGRD